MGAPTLATQNAAPASMFYQRVMRALAHADIPFLVGGTYAMAHYTGTDRATKDLDLFLRRDEVEAAMRAIARAGFRTELTHPHFLAKAFSGPDFVDLIFSSGNGACAVDDDWFTHAPAGVLFGQPVHFCPAEETLWSKAFVMERERFDGHDVAHLLRARADTLDWPRLLSRFDGHWRILLAQIVVFGFIDPADRRRVPPEVMRSLVARLVADPADATTPEICYGTLLSRSQYLDDVRRHGLIDARREPRGAMNADEIDRWTAAIDDPTK